MNRYAAAALLWGFALGVVVYRYVALPLDWTSPWKHVFVGGAIGLAVAARQLVRVPADSSERKRPALPLLLAIGVAGGLVAIGMAYLAFPSLDRASISPREFPGFSIALPSGEVTEDRQDYAAGKLTMKNTGNARGVAIVGWELGGPMSEQELQMVGELLVKTIGPIGASTLTKLRGPDGTSVDSIVFGGDMSMTMSVLVCGRRRVFVATGGSDPAPGLHERILASFVCKPDPAKEGTAAMTVALVIDLPGWYMGVREADQIGITDGENMLLLRPQYSSAQVDLAMLVEPMFKAAGVQGRVTSRAGDRVNIAMSDGTDEMNGWMRLVPCPTGSTLVLAIGVSSESLDLMYERVGSARCLRPGEAAQVWPDPPANAPLP